MTSSSGAGTWPAFRSTVLNPAGGGAFELDTALQDLRRELATGENLLLNTVHLAPDHVRQLRSAVADNGWIDRVEFSP